MAVGMDVTNEVQRGPMRPNEAQVERGVRKWSPPSRGRGVSMGMKTLLSPFLRSAASHGGNIDIAIVGGGATGVERGRGGNRLWEGTENAWAALQQGQVEPLHVASAFEPLSAFAVGWRP